MSDIINYRCPNCGGEIAFHAGNQKLTCEYCDSQFTVEELEKYQQYLKQQEQKDESKQQTAQTADTSWDDENLNEYVCGSCGGTIICDANTAATTCPYCDSPVVIKGRVSGQLQPDFVIPFIWDKEQAIEQMKKHFKGKVLLPKAFKTGHKLEEIKGVYVPFWLFDSEADAYAQFDATKVSTWRSGNYRYTKTDTYRLHRDASMMFEKVPVDGSTRMDDAYMEAIEPYDYSKLTGFKPAYLAGFMADKYDVDAFASIPRAQQRMQNTTVSEIRNSIHGYDTCKLSSVQMNYTKQASRYALLPVWVLNATYGGKKYRFAMNGQTGKFVGELPVSWGKFWALLLSTLVLTVPVGYFLAEVLIAAISAFF